MLREALVEVGGESTAVLEGGEFRSPVKKLSQFFRRSRDGWKRKARAAKTRCKLLGNQVRAVERSRAAWRSKAQEASRQVQELQRQLDELQRGQPV